jgi:putative alpha-1,2-mannosidase
MLTWRIGCKESSMVNSRELDAYKKIGYVPVGIKRELVCIKTLEYAYDDWCLAEFAKALHKTADYNYFLKRSENWRNLYDLKVHL